MNSFPEIPRHVIFNSMALFFARTLAKLLFLLGIQYLHLKEDFKFTHPLSSDFLILYYIYVIYIPANDLEKKMLSPMSSL